MDGAALPGSARRTGRPASNLTAISTSELLGKSAPLAQFDGRIAIVTGGTQGLGAIIARLFTDRGAAGLVICGRNRERGEAKAAEIEEETGTTTWFIPADLGNVEDCRAFVAKADKEFGRVDILVNAAALTDRGTTVDTSPELFDAVFATNVRGPFVLMQDVIRVDAPREHQGHHRQYRLHVGHCRTAFHCRLSGSKGALRP